MSVRLIAFDLDGTLLDEKKRISEANSAALLAAAMKGIWLVPCTARYLPRGDLTGDSGETI